MKEMNNLKSKAIQDMLALAEGKTECKLACVLIKIETILRELQDGKSADSLYDDMYRLCGDIISLNRVWKFGLKKYETSKVVGALEMIKDFDEAVEMESMFYFNTYGEHWLHIVVQYNFTPIRWAAHDLSWDRVKWISRKYQWVV